MSTQSYLSFVKQYDKKTYHWLMYQKKLKNKGLLPVDRCEKLEQLYSFNWERKLSTWEENYLQYKKIITNTSILPTWKINQRLYQWLYEQKKRKDTLTLKRITLLEQLPGFTWEKINTPNIWKENYTECKKIVTKTSMLPKQKSHPRLYGWLKYQKKHKNKLTTKQITLLNDLYSFNWGNKTHIWKENYTECKKIINETNELPKQKSHPKYYKWLKYQKKHKNKLTLEQITLLETLPNWC